MSAEVRLSPAFIRAKDIMYFMVLFIFVSLWYSDLFFHNIVLPDAIVLDGIQIEFFLLPRDWRKSCNLFVDKHYYLLYWGL